MDFRQHGAGRVEIQANGEFTFSLRYDATIRFNPHPCRLCEPGK